MNYFAALTIGGRATENAIYRFESAADAQALAGALEAAGVARVRVVERPAAVTGREFVGAGWLDWLTAKGFIDSPQRARLESSGVGALAAAGPEYVSGSEYVAGSGHPEPDYLEGGGHEADDVPEQDSTGEYYSAGDFVPDDPDPYADDQGPDLAIDGGRDLMQIYEQAHDMDTWE